MSRPNYAEHLDAEGANVPGPSKHDITMQEGKDSTSGSEFSVKVALEGDADEESSLSELDELVDDNESVSSHEEAAATSSRKPQKQKRKPMTSERANLVQRRLGKLPSLHHRHRALSIYKRVGSSERLACQPRLFQPVDVVPTKSWGSNDVVQMRTAKAGGFNCGSGPSWELLEDRGWYCEATDTQPESESVRRPRVYKDISSTAEIVVLDLP